MIVVDTSALIAIIASEPEADRCQRIIEQETTVLISAATLAEALIIAARKEFSDDTRYLMATSVTSVVELASARAERAAEAYTRWGKNFHRAALNYGDCFAYATAREFDCPLLYIGNDFIQTDITAAIPAPHP